MVKVKLIGGPMDGEFLMVPKIKPIVYNWTDVSMDLIGNAKLRTGFYTPEGEEDENGFVRFVWDGNVVVSEMPKGTIKHLQDRAERIFYHGDPDEASD